MRVLILGVAGMLGHKVLQHFVARGDDVTGTVTDVAPSVARIVLGERLPDLAELDWRARSRG
jgi:nucleoside-diphosphate-sugar epimerase